MEWWRDATGQRAHPRLFPRREPAGRARLALPRRALRQRDGTIRRAGSCTGCSREHVVEFRAERSVPAQPTAGLCRTGGHHQFLLPARRLASGRTGRAGEALGLAGIGIADRNTVAGVVRAHVAASAQGRSEQAAELNRGRRAARLRRRHARHSGLSARPRRLGPADAAALARQAPRGEGRLHPRPADLLEFIEGLNLIVMPPARIRCRQAACAAAAAEARGLDERGLARRRHALSRRRPAPAQARSRAIAERSLVPLIAVNDVLYHAPERRACRMSSPASASI